jgi:hypothetical protein
MSSLILIYVEEDGEVASDGVALIEYLEELFEGGTSVNSEDGDEYADDEK